MQNFCKIFLSLLFGAILGVLLVGCGDSTSGDAEVTLLPDNGLGFMIYPNDMAVGDSVEANLAHGVKLRVHPRATYEISFDSTAGDAPNMQVFRLFLNKTSGYYSGRKVRDLKPSVANGRFTYSFKCEENEMSLWAVTLEQDGTYYTGKTKNVRMTGEGSYDDNFSLNLIVVGNVENDFDGFTIDDLADSLLRSFRKYYVGVTIDTLYVNYASKHPTLGSKYPANEPWIAGYSSSDVMLSELGGWPGVENALDLVLVHYINESGVVGYSDLFSGNMGSGEGSTVVLGAYAHSAMYDLAENIKEITETAVHETGHFFGLRHTTATTADKKSVKDYSIVEDGFDDTPYCNALLKSNLYKTTGSDDVTDFRTEAWNRGFVRMPAVGIAEYNVDNCPDANNVMFPLTSTDGYTGFSDEQLATLRANLMIYPH